MQYVRRQAEQRLTTLLRTFPAVLVLGPRQCGKSTLLRHVRPSAPFVDLERPADRAQMAADIEGFLDGHRRGAVIDEAQQLPEIFPALRHALDRSSGNGRFLMTGSASPSLMRAVSETLAGRVGLLELTPFRAMELAGSRMSPGHWFWGGYPPVHALRGANRRGLWLDAYVSTFLERDLPAFGVRLPPQRLRLLWTMLTHVHGNVLNVSDLARSLAVSSHTIDGDLDVLEQTFMIRRLRPYFANVQKRLTKSAKLYIRDTGLLHFLAGLRAPRELQTWSRRGASFEGYVIEEIIARANSRLVRPEPFYWRTQAGAEADLLLVHGRHVTPYEIKAGSTVEPRSLAGLRQCMADLGLKRGYVVYGGRERRAIGDSIELLPWPAIARGEIEIPLV